MHTLVIQNARPQTTYVAPTPEGMLIDEQKFGLRRNTNGRRGSVVPQGAMLELREWKIRSEVDMQDHRSWLRSGDGIANTSHAAARFPDASLALSAAT
jgi:hypothetical protein